MLKILDKSDKNRRAFRKLDTILKNMNKTFFGIKLCRA